MTTGRNATALKKAGTRHPRYPALPSPWSSWPVAGGALLDSYQRSRRKTREVLREQRTRHEDAGEHC